LLLCIAGMTIVLELKCDVLLCASHFYPCKLMLQNVVHVRLCHTNDFYESFVSAVTAILSYSASNISQAYSCICAEALFIFDVVNFYSLAGKPA